VSIVSFFAVRENFRLDPKKKKDFDPGSEIRWSRGIGTLFFLVSVL
jgi:hypothetical protein